MESDDTTQTNTLTPHSTERMILLDDGRFVLRNITTNEEVILLTKEEVCSVRDTVVECLDFLYHHGIKTSSIIRFEVWPEEKEPMIFDFKANLGPKKAPIAAKLIDVFAAKYHHWG